MTTLYLIAYGSVLFLLLMAAAVLLLRGFELNLNDFLEDDYDEDEDGGLTVFKTGPEIPLPPGITLPKSDFEPEYNKQKEFA